MVYASARLVLIYGCKSLDHTQRLKRKFSPHKFSLEARSQNGAEEACSVTTSNGACLLLYFTISFLVWRIKEDRMDRSYDACLLLYFTISFLVEGKGQ